MIRAYDENDAEPVLRLNELAVPNVGEMDAEKLAFFAANSPWFQVLEVDGKVEGFIILLVEASRGYTSPNFRWFLKRHERFAYIDRVAINEELKRHGHGRTLYDAAETWTREHARALLCAEVNTVPNNIPSHRFHHAQSFREVARTRPYGPEKEVAMYEKYLD